MEGVVVTSNTDPVSLTLCVPTGVQINTSSQILISRTAAKAVFETPNAYYIPGVPYRGKVIFFPCFFPPHHLPRNLVSSKFCPNHFLFLRQSSMSHYLAAWLQFLHFNSLMCLHLQLLLRGKTDVSAGMLACRMLAGARVPRALATHTFWSGRVLITLSFSFRDEEAL